MPIEDFFRLQRRRSFYWRYYAGTDARARIRETNKAGAEHFATGAAADAKAQYIYRIYQRTYIRFPREATW